MTAATKDKKDTEQTTRSDAKKVQIGSKFSRHSYGTVMGIGTNDDGVTRYTLHDENGFEWYIDGENILEMQFSFADQFESEEKLSRTEINQIIMDKRGIAMTICFRKKADHKEVAKELAKGQGSESDRAWTKQVKELIEGHERVMVGHHGGQLDDHQRLKFAETGTGQRLVDMRTTQWVICDRVKYVVKTK